MPPIARARHAAEQFRALDRAASLVLPLLPNTTEREDFEQLHRKLEEGLNGLATLEGAALERAIDPLEGKLRNLEQRFQALDAMIPMAWFRERFDVTQASSVALADYATLLGRHAGDDPGRLDRIQFLLTRLVALFVKPAHDSPALRRRLLAEALPPSPLDDTTRQAVLTFFADARRRLAAFGSLKALIDSGFFLDVRGYKQSLRHQLLDPEVMASVIELNAATSETIERLAAAEQTGEKDLKAHLAEVDQRIKAIFAAARTDEEARAARLSAWLKRARQAREEGKKPPRLEEFKPGAPSRVNRKVVLATLALGLGLLLTLRTSGEQKLKELGPTDCSAISPLVTSCAVAPAARPRVLIGQVDKAQWALMEHAARFAVASDVAAHVAEHSLVAGTVLLEGRVVIQVENGQVLVVQ